MKRLRLTGVEADLRVALDRLHVHATVLGVVESEGACEVAIQGACPELGAVTVEALDAAVVPFTGLEDDKAIWVGETIVIRPPWVASPTGFAGIELVVSRAMAFGSGEHGSTQAALGMLERLYVPAIRSIADIGTGTGILALYARARGCEGLFACDIDPDAVAAARELLPGGHVVCGGPEAIEVTVDAVVANMRGTEIRACLAGILALWNRRGPLVLSGLRPDEIGAFDGDVGRSADERIAVGGFSALGWSSRRSGPGGDPHGVFRDAPC